MKGRFAVAQMRGCADWAENCRLAANAVKQARDSFDADLILFPETFASYVTSGADKEQRIALAQDIDGPFTTAMRDLAREYQIWIVFGMRECAGEKNYNTIIVINNTGELVTTYHKTHLYDAFSAKESDEFRAGDKLFEPIQTPFGCLGLFVCYEVRFPEIARNQALRGAEILLMPTAWVKGPRKQEQLQILSQARALENTVYLLASNLCQGECTGGSMIIDPLGKVLAEAGEEPELLYVAIDTETIRTTKEALPSLKNRRTELYETKLC